jgi:hypothetical protein
MMKKDKGFKKKGVADEEDDPMDNHADACCGRIWGYHHMEREFRKLDG